MIDADRIQELEAENGRLKELLRETAPLIEHLVNEGWRGNDLATLVSRIHAEVRDD